MNLPKIPYFFRKLLLNTTINQCVVTAQCVVFTPSMCICYYTLVGQKLHIGSNKYTLRGQKLHIGMLFNTH